MVQPHAAPRSIALDYAVGICGVWISGGFFLDAWAHGHVPVESFFTPYHAVFYSGMVALAIVLVSFVLRSHSRGYDWPDTVPRAYRLALLGVPIFVAGGVGDMLWHHALGIEEGVDALLSPTHQILGLGIFFLASGPIRSVLADRAHSTTLARQLPLALGLATWLILAHFGTAYAFDPAAGRTNAPPPIVPFDYHYLTSLAIGYYKVASGVLIVIFQSTLIAGFALWLVARIHPCPGMVTLILLIGNVPAAAAFTNHTPLLAVTVAQALIAGALADTLIVTLRPASVAGPRAGLSLVRGCRADDVRRHLFDRNAGDRRHLVGLERRAGIVDLVGRVRTRAEPVGGRATRLSRGALVAAALVLHAATAWRYGYFRDELYFIACAKHLAWGYVDQPPMVAFAAWLAAPLGYGLVALRALPILAAALTVWLAMALARELGGGRYAQLLAGTATLLAPAYLLLGNTLTTTSFEPLFWTLSIYLAVRIVRAPAAEAPRWWLSLAAALALGAYCKYSIALAVAALAVGAALTPQRRTLLTGWTVLAAGFAFALVAPNLGWQAMHGWPFLDVLRGDAAHRPSFQNGLALESRDLAINARDFALEQLLYTNPVAAPIWLAGLIAPLRVAALRDLRFITIAYAIAFVAAVALAAKGYYIVGFYAALFAIGAVALERASSAVRVALCALIVASGIAAAPLSLPVLPVESLIAYAKALGLTGRDGSPAHLIQPVFAEEFGWERLARDVARVYGALPAAERRDAAVYADTYGDAGALDFYGPRYGLPPAISSQNNYYLWGTRGYDGKTMIAIGATRIDLLRKYYRSVVLVGTSTEPYRWVVEGPAPIYLCRDPIAPLTVIWPALRWYGA